MFGFFFIKHIISLWISWRSGARWRHLFFSRTCWVERAPRWALLSVSFTYSDKRTFHSQLIVRKMDLYHEMLSGGQGRARGGPLLLPAGISEAETLHAHQRMFLNWGPLTFTFTFLGSLTEPKSGNLCKWDATSLAYFSYCSVTVFLIYCNSITDTMLD